MKSNNKNLEIEIITIFYTNLISRTIYIPASSNSSGSSGLFASSGSFDSFGYFF
ncbi:hypothetical protein DDB_G0267970 [Dictyostelium discoideum AX4]|uniref:Putative uncharacterized protein DDB_G0267970 n=1 Tax=Dictyostelium discoideum TaxID=44689 RepID=Y9684_DICDI|nr:hypothetical protein DDB_G0267970 [Dictyostelium discoideum AX4]Q55FS8.1 RecName: Full=Putative uncharacterized protein DDB_G0267970 [Dictyostelium discoideum]EAL73438.1 hypothetical protein DDB_G0267970 [Dictyostelium discoideum AX4]|eukprot:XP_647455.1 hypothetical protein DDB_G0267970 [Dictyostelium discoideum AX4]